MNSATSGGRQAGLSLLELIIFVVVISIGIVGILSVMNLTTKKSADPMVRKQALAIAEALLEEVALHKFTYCDPDDANVAVATSATVGAGQTNCATAAEAIGQEAGETRYSALTPFDNVNDYNTFSMAAITTLDNVAVAALNGYSASVSVSAVGATFSLPDNSAALRIDVRVQGKGEDITLTGYRFRYAPNAAG